jgi:hypothetical protein
VRLELEIALFVEGLIKDVAGVLRMALAQEEHVQTPSLRLRCVRNLGKLFIELCFANWC